MASLATVMKSARRMQVVLAQAEHSLRAAGVRR